MTSAAPRRASLDDELATLLVEAEQARPPTVRRLVTGGLTRAQKARELVRVQQRRG